MNQSALPAAHALFVPGDPARLGRFALWGPDIGDDDGDVDLLEIFHGPASDVRKLATPVRYLTIAEALPLLLADRDKSPSLAAWSAAARTGLHLVAGGLLRPAVTEGGYGLWRIGTLANTDAQLLDEHADALPPEGYAQALPGAWPAVRVPEPATLVRELWDALADTLAREVAPGEDDSVHADPHPFAAWAPARVRGPRGWLRPAGDARLVLRVVTPLSSGQSRRGSGARVGVFGAGAPENREADDPCCLLQPWLRSTLDPSLWIKAETLWDAPAVVMARFGSHPESAALAALRRGARIWPPLAAMLETAVPGPISLPDRLFEELLDHWPVLSAADIEVRVPTELVTAPLEPQAVAAALEPDADAFFGLADLLRLTWRPAAGGDVLTEQELAELAAAKTSLVRLRGRWVRLDAATLRRLRAGRGPLTAAAALAATLEGGLDLDGEWVRFEATGDLAALGSRLTGVSPGAAPAPVAIPTALNAILRPYQERGLAWLAAMAERGLGGCLADDMGLGKTIQIIALHLHLHRGGPPDTRGPTLVVCPTSLLGNWEREVARFAPGTPVRRYHGTGRHLAGVASDEIVLATYGLLRTDAAALAEVSWGLVVADEAQNVKNPLAYTTQQLRALPAAARIALTGTPVENRLTELWSVLDWTTPGLLGPLADFQRRLAGPIERDRDPQAAERLTRLTRPFLLRRRKGDPDIAPELPARTETDRLVPLTAEQASLYQAVADHGLAEIQMNPHTNVRALVLRLLTSLKQVCNHPAQYLHETGPLPGRSGKLDALDDLLEVILAEGESVLVFSQYVQMGTLIERHLAAQDIKTLFLHGRSPDRDAIVAAFQAGAAPVLLLSLKAGGVGLNLTRATHVVHYDRWWNPAVEDQASDRAHRIGQQHPVQIHRMVTEGTLEEKIAALLTSKRELAETVIGTGDAWLANLSTAEVAELVKLGDKGGHG
ncbi:DEAD/DEAH box helicase [Catenulispora pinisilvae]|uniref:DEAD/DEAH box helicase n=1 Tax=Catenulispora pinisilvae TaxID=2705253 RepID=UPI002B26DC1E|nr:DEAD/DEAH box helicase [Catenulispora pinisilvae]